MSIRYSKIPIERIDAKIFFIMNFSQNDERFEMSANKNVVIFTRELYREIVKINCKK